jgi:hypothetical protein
MLPEWVRHSVVARSGQHARRVLPQPLGVPRVPAVGNSPCLDRFGFPVVSVVSQVFEKVNGACPRTGSCRLFSRLTPRVISQNCRRRYVNSRSSFRAATTTGSRRGALAFLGSGMAPSITDRFLITRSRPPPWPVPGLVSNRKHVPLSGRELPWPSIPTGTYHRAPETAVAARRICTAGLAIRNIFRCSQS